jgi:hypothetical protein
MLVLIACGGGQVPPPPSGDSAVLAPNTIVLDDELTALIDATADGVYTFSSRVGDLAAVQAGSVILADVSEFTPYGLIATVDSVVPNGPGVILNTTPAGLGDAFESLNLSVEFSAQAEQFDVRAAQAGITFPIDIEAGGGGGNVRLQGSLGVAPIVDIVLDINVLAFELEEFSLTFGASESFEAIVTGSGTASFEESVTLGTIPFTPFVVPIPTPSGVVPVPVTPVVVIEATLSGSLQGQVEASVVQQASFSSSIGYVNGSWGATSDSDSDFDFDQPTFSASANLKASAGARLEARILGMVGPYAKASAYVEMNALAETPPPCVRGVLDAGIAAEAGIDITVAEWGTVLFNESFPLADFDSCDPNSPRPATTWARSYGRQGSIGENARAVVQAPDGTYLVAGDSTLVSGITGAAASVWVQRLDSLGNVMWQKAFSGQAASGVVTSAAALDDGFLVATTLGLMRLDTGGNVLWAGNLGSDVTILSLDTKPDGTTVLAGRYGAMSEAWAATVTPSGSVTWSNTYGSDSFNRVRVTSDGGYVATGVDPGNASDLVVVKLTAGGDVQWRTTINNRYDSSNGTVPQPTILDSTDAGRDVIQRADGTYLVVGETYGAFPLPQEGQAGHYALFELELSASGELLEDPSVHRIVNEANYTTGYAVALRSNGSSVVVGRYAPQVSDLFTNERILLLQGAAFSVLGASGNNTVMGGLLGGGVGSMPIAATADGGVIIAGTSDAFGANDEAWVVKFGRTLALGSGLIGGVSGDSYQNPHAVALSLGGVVTEAPVVAQGVAVTVEVTPAFVRVQVP